MKALAIKINEPWWGAWKQFGWANRSWGVGLKKADVESAIVNGQTLEIFIRKNKKSYTIDPAKVKEYSQTNKTQFLAKHDTLLYVVPEFLLNGTNT